MNTSSAVLTPPITRESRDSGRWRRRAVTIPAMYLLAIVGIAAFPIALPLAILVDLVRGRSRKFAFTRCVVFFFGYLVGEMSFIALAGLQWVFAPGWLASGEPRLRRWAHWLSRTWGADYLDKFGRWCFSVKLDITGAEALDKGGPIIAFLRHASAADNLFAPLFFGDRGGFDVLYVAKWELQHDPIFDIIGNRIRSCFVRRGSGQSDKEISRVIGLLDNLQERDAIIVYPEGTRFTEQKRAKILEAIEKKGDAALTARARGLKHVLPPRLGGPVALLERAVDEGIAVDLVFCQHAGYEGAATFKDFIDGHAIGRHVRVHFERVAFSDLPRGREALTEWFYQRWEKLDAWIDVELPKVIAKSD